MAGSGSQTGEFAPIRGGANHRPQFTGDPNRPHGAGADKPANNPILFKPTRPLEGIKQSGLLTGKPEAGQTRNYESTNQIE